MNINWKLSVYWTIRLSIFLLLKQARSIDLLIIWKEKTKKWKQLNKRNDDRNIYLSVGHITSMALHTGSTESSMSQSPVPYKLWRHNVTRQA